MLYGKLVARISEVSRTLISRGNSGTHNQNSSVFLCEEGSWEGALSKKNAPRPRWLRVHDGSSWRTYEIVSVQGNELHVREPFTDTASDREWEVYDGGVSEEDVRKTLHCFPDAIMELEEGEQVKTHLGVVKVVRRKRKRVKDPQGRWTCSPERLQARLRPGKRLQRLLDAEPSEDPEDVPSPDKGHLEP